MRNLHHAARDYAKSPMNVYWEMTQACSLACRHCRAEAISTAHPRELNFKESVAFLRQIPEFGEPPPQLILTGGDPLARTDLYDLIDEARKLRIGVSITPAATPALTRDVMLRLKQHGVEGLGLSLDGSNAERHDSIRGMPGTFDRTIQALRWAQELEMPVQVNTLAAAETAEDMHCDLRSTETVRHRPLEPVFPDSRRARKGSSPAVAGRWRKTHALDPRDFAGSILHCGNDRGSVVPARDARTDASRGDDGRADPAKRRDTQLWNPRRPWRPVRFEHRRYLSSGIPAVSRG